MDEHEQLSLESGLGELRGLVAGIRIAIADLGTNLRDHITDDKQMRVDMRTWMDHSDENRAKDALETVVTARTIALDVVEHARLIAAETLTVAKEEALEKAIADRKAAARWKFTTAWGLVGPLIGVVGGIGLTFLKAWLDHPV